jgi:recombination protein RecR
VELPKKLLDLTDFFSRFPGVGDKTALRQTLFMSKWTPNELAEFGNCVKELASLKKCVMCGMFADDEKCSVCNSEERGEAKTLCVIETITDCLAIERSGFFRGRFHILGGVLNPLVGIGPEELGLDHLFERIKNDEIEEVILAVNPSVEGDATCSFIKDSIDSNLKVERIGFGVPMGGSLEYLDSLTISKALENRQKM